MERTSVDKYTVMIAEELRAKAKSPALTAPRRSRELLKETKYQRKKVPSGLTPQTQARPHPPGIAGAITADSEQSEDRRRVTISPPNKAKYTRQQPSKSFPI